MFKFVCVHMHVCMNVPLCCNWCCFFELLRNFIHIAPVYPAVAINGYLVLSWEAAHPPETPMGNWRSKYHSCLANGCSPDGTLCANTTTLGMVQPHLWDNSPIPGGFAST